jgi:hypothetical protein
MSLIVANDYAPIAGNYCLIHHVAVGLPVTSITVMTSKYRKAK